MNERIASLEGVAFADIHACFTAAFADYAVQSVAMPESALRRRARKNNYDPALSAGAWAGDELVAVSLTGLDRVTGELRGYDIATGIVPDHRGQGVAGRMLQQVVPRLRQAGADAFQLEVLQSNAPGIRAYEKAGFTATRGLVSCALPAQSVLRQPGVADIRDVALSEVIHLSPELDFEPSYEQRDTALVHLESELIFLGAFEGDSVAGGLAYDPGTAWLMRLVTRRDSRRQGIATALLAALAGRLAEDHPIKAVNIDDRDSATLALMKHCGFTESIRQWEMRLELHLKAGPDD